MQDVNSVLEASVQVAANNRSGFWGGGYTPEFGGYDAEGMARGFKRRSDPTVWVLIDGKVYLHYTIEDQNRWAEDIRGNIRLGEKNWETLKDL